MKNMRKLTAGFGAAALAALAVLLVLPVVLVLITGHEAGMLVSIFLLLVVDPFFFAFMGMYGAKKGAAAGWKGVAVSVAAFVLGALLGLQMGFDFVVKYAAAYCLIAFTAMGITALVLAVKRKKKKQ